MNVFLVSGGAGFIGSNFIKYLLKTKDDIKVVNVDKLTYAGDLTNLDEIKDWPNYTFIHEDICNKQGMKEVFSIYHPHYVINFAAETHVDRSIKNSESFIRTNVLGTQVLLDLSLACPYIKKFVQISTDEVYGSLDFKGLPFTEESLLHPTNPYAASKAGADLLVLSYKKTFGLPVNITRCTNNYGPCQHKEKYIPLLITNCISGNELPIYGEGKNIRDWIHVNDHCRAIDLIIQNAPNGEIYNIGADHELENIKVAYQVIHKVNKCIQDEIKICADHINTDLIRYIEDRKGHDKRYALSTEKIKRELGWQPTIDFETGLMDTVLWYLEKYRGELQ